MSTGEHGNKKYIGIEWVISRLNIHAFISFCKVSFPGLIFQSNALSISKQKSLSEAYLWGETVKDINRKNYVQQNVG